MYEKMTEQPESPKASQYRLGNGKYARVILEVQQRKNDRVEIEAQAFEIDADGTLLSAPSGAASRTSGTTHVIATSGIAGGTHTLKPGWVRIVGDYNEDTFNADAPRVTEKPTEAGEFNAQAYDTTTGIGYRYDMGELERIRQGKCDEMLAIINQSSQLADLDFT